MAIPIRSLGLKNLDTGGASAAAKALLNHMVEEAYGYVQGESLKARTALLWKLLSSPITREERTHARTKGFAASR